MNRGFETGTQLLLILMDQQKYLLLHTMCMYNFESIPLTLLTATNGCFNFGSSLFHFQPIHAI